MLIDIILIALILFFAIRFFKLGVLGLAVRWLRIIISVSVSALFGRALSTHLFDELIVKTFDGALGVFISLIISYVSLFLISYALSALIFIKVRRNHTPIVIWLDKAGGLILGLAIGISIASLLSTVLYSGIETLSNIIDKPELLAIYSDSRIFRYMYRLNIFDIIKRIKF